MTRRMMTVTTICRMVLLLLPFYYSLSAAAPNCILSDPISIHKDGSVTMEQAADYDAGTFTMRITYTAGRSYVGIGVNLNGGTGMVPAKAVIGRGYDDGTSNTVLKYDLNSDAKDGSGVIPSVQTLSDTSFIQTESSSILTFTQPLQDDADGLYISESSSWIFAVGLQNNQWEGKHTIHGSFSFALSPCVYAATNSPTEVPMNAAPVANSPTEVPGTVPVDPTISEGGDEDENEEEEESNVDQGTTTESDGGDNTSNAVNGNNLGIVFFNTEKPYRTLWAAHGILMALAWGVCAPLGIGAAVFMKRLDAQFQQWAASHPNLIRNPKGLWYQIHYTMNLATIGLTLMGFLLAYIATAKEEGALHLENGHHKIGWAITILCVVQATLAYFRPALPPPPTTTTKSPPSLDYTPSKPHVDGDDVEIEIPSKGNGTASEGNTRGGGGKSLSRVAWEWSHRLLGLLLLCLALFNCLSGCELDAENFPATHDKTGAFGGVTGGLCMAMAILAFFAWRK